MRCGGKLLRFVGVEVTGALVELEELIRVKGGGQYGVHTTYLAMGAPCDNCCQGKPLGVNTPIIRHLYGYTSLAGCRALECVGQVSQKTHLMELEATQVPSGDAGVPAPSGRDEGGRTRPKKLINALEHIETRLEQRVEITHPRGLEEPRRAKTQSCSTRQRRQPLGTYKGPAGRAHHRDTAPGDPRGELEASRGVEGVRERETL